MSQILDFFADNPQVAASIAKTVPAIMGAHQASKAKNAIEGPGGYQEKLENLERNRQELVNPYATLSNPFANLQVATKAARMQAEQSDIALANTLDTLRATGASAGGATALAQAALQSKKGIAASIEKQEAQNDKLRAQGEQTLQQNQIKEQQRIQNIALSEGRRTQSAEAQGAAYVFATEENRINADLDRAAGQLDQARAQQASSNQAKAAAWGGVASGVGDVLGSLAGAA